MRLIPLLSISLLLFAAPSCAPLTSSRHHTPEDPDPLGKTITRLIIRQPGPYPALEKSRLSALIGSQPGSRLSEDRLNQDIVQLVNSGLVDNVSFAAKKSGTGIKLIATVEPRPPMGYGPGPVIVGNTLFPDTTLATASGLVSQKISTSRLHTARARIEDFYHLNGYPKAKVGLKIERDCFCRFKRIAFVIDEGLKSP